MGGSSKAARTVEGGRARVKSGTCRMFTLIRLQNKESICIKIIVDHELQVDF